MQYIIWMDYFFCVQLHETKRLPASIAYGTIIKYISEYTDAHFSFSIHLWNSMDKQINGLLICLVGILIVASLIGVTIIKYLCVGFGFYLILTGLKMLGHRPPY